MKALRSASVVVSRFQALEIRRIEAEYIFSHSLNLPTPDSDEIYDIHAWIEHEFIRPRTTQGCGGDDIGALPS